MFIFTDDVKQMWWSDSDWIWPDVCKWTFGEKRHWRMNLFYTDSLCVSPPNHVCRKLNALQHQQLKPGTVCQSVCGVWTTRSAESSAIICNPSTVRSHGLGLGGPTFDPHHHHHQIQITRLVRRVSPPVVTTRETDGGAQKYGDVHLQMFATPLAVRPTGRLSPPPPHC